MKKSFALQVLEDSCSRRALLQGIGAVASLAVLPASGCATQGADVGMASATTCPGGLCIDLTVASNAALTKPGGALLVDSATDVIMVIRVSDTEVKALSAICTHASCTVGFSASQALLVCPCHGSEFDEGGHVVKGPARTALKVYTATLANDTITIAA